MTHEQSLRAEAEKVALRIMPLCTVCQEKAAVCSAPHEEYRQFRGEIADCLVAFAQKHGDRERLRGQIQELERFWIEQGGLKPARLRELQSDLAALEKGEEVAG